MIFSSQLVHHCKPSISTIARWSYVYATIVLMTHEYFGAQFEASPSRPAPCLEVQPSKKIVDKLAEMLPRIQEIKTEEVKH